MAQACKNMLRCQRPCRAAFGVQCVRPSQRRPSPAASSALYHSDAFPDPAPFPPAQSAILSQALSHVPRHGFTEKSLLLGARDAGYLDVSIQLFPRKAYDLVNYYRVTRRLALKDRVQFDEEKAKMGIGRKVRLLALERLRMNAEDGIVDHLQGVSLKPGGDIAHPF